MNEKVFSRSILFALALFILLGPCVGSGLIVDAVILPWTENVNLGNTNYSLDIWVSILDMNGNPVEGLNIGNLRVSTLMIPKEFYRRSVSIKSVDNVYMDQHALNIYDVHIAPNGNWSEGGYVLLIEVQKGNELGQTMVPFTMHDWQPLNESLPVASSPPSTI